MSTGQSGGIGVPPVCGFPSGDVESVADGAVLGAALLLAHWTCWGSQLGTQLLVLLLSLALAATGLIQAPVDSPWSCGPLTALAEAVLLLLLPVLTMVAVQAIGLLLLIRHQRIGLSKMLGVEKAVTLLS